MYFNGASHLVARAAFGSHMNNMYGTALSETRPTNKISAPILPRVGRQRESLNQPSPADIRRRSTAPGLHLRSQPRFRGISLIQISVTTYSVIFRDEYFARFY